jgi:hypothetical protein
MLHSRIDRTRTLQGHTPPICKHRSPQCGPKWLSLSLSPSLSREQPQSICQEQQRKFAEQQRWSGTGARPPGLARVPARLARFVSESGVGGRRSPSCRHAHLAGSPPMCIPTHVCCFTQLRLLLQEDGVEEIITATLGWVRNFLQ